MSEQARVPGAVSGLLFISLLDLSLRFYWLERGVYGCNDGAFWGLGLSRELILGAGTLALAGLGWLLVQETNRKVKLALLAMLVGGSLNWVDRLFTGCVLDYLTWPLGLSAIFPNFNLGDMLLLLGLFWLGYSYWKRSRMTYASQGILGSDIGTRRGSGRD